MTTPSPAQLRIAAARVIAGVFRGQKANVLLERHAGAMDPRSRAWVHEAAYGVLRRFFSLEADVSRFLKRKPQDDVRALLWLGAYQIRHMQTPQHAAVSATVEAAKTFCPCAAGLVNAVLRRVAESESPRRLKPYQRAELPQWMYRHWRDAFGGETVQTFSPALQRPPGLALAVLGERQAWIRRARDAGLHAEPGRHAPQAVVVHGAVDVTSLPGYAEGQVLVMDQAAQMAVHALPPIKGGRVLDLCAAPGGKGALLAATMPDSQVISVELSAARIPRMRQNMERLGHRNHCLLQADATVLPFPDASIERVLLDAPCSASGILRRHPDAKFLHGLDELVRFAERQRRLLAEALRVLQPGGFLLYAVCSIHGEENEHVLEPFAERVVEHRRIFPSDEHDGFFFALIQG